MIDNKIKNKIIKFINKYLRIDMNDDLYFVKTFFPKIVIDAKVMDLTLLKKYFAHYNEEYYEYDLNDKIKEYKRLSLNKNKLVIAKSLKRGFVYNEKYDRLCIFSCGRFDLYRYFGTSHPENKKKFEYSDHDLINITAEKKVVDERYTTRLKNPSEAYKFIIDMLYVYGFHYSRGDMDYKKFSEITKEEKDVLIDIVCDLDTYFWLLTKDAYKYLYDEKIQKLYEDIVSCDAMDMSERAHYYISLYGKTYDSKYKKGVECAFKNGEYEDVSKWNISYEDYKAFQKIILMNDDEFARDYALQAHLDKYKDETLNERFAIFVLYDHILHVNLKNYEEFVDEFLDCKLINDDVVEKWAYNYSNIVPFKKLLELYPTANCFSLESHIFHSAEMSEEEIIEHNLPNFECKYLNKEDELRKKYDNFDEETKKYREIAKEYLRYEKDFGWFFTSSYNFYERCEVEENPLSIYSLEIEYYNKMKEILIDRNIKNNHIDIDVLDRNIIKTERKQIWRNYEYPKKRKYYIKLNEETKEWLINKKWILGLDAEELSSLILYHNDDVLCEYESLINKEESNA